MLIFAEGFDDFTTAADVLLSAASAVPIFEDGLTLESGRGGNGKALACRHYSTADWTFPACIVCIAGFAMTATEPDPLNEGAAVTLYAGAVKVFQIRQINPATLLLVDSAGAQIGTAPTRNFAGYIEVKADTATGHLTVRADGATVFDEAANLGAAPVDHIGIESRSAVLLFDDLYIADATGPRNNDFFGDTRVISDPPTGDGAEQQATPSTPGPHFGLVSEVPVDRDASYVAATAAAQTDTYTFAPIPATLTIRAVNLVAYARSESGGATAVAAVTRIAGVDHAAAPQPLPAVYRAIASNFEVNPATGQPWTAAEVNAAEFGFGVDVPGPGTGSGAMASISPAADTRRVPVALTAYINASDTPKVATVIAALPMNWATN